MDELKPCPFCAATDPKLYKPTCTKLSTYTPSDRAFPVIRCQHCYAEVCGKDWDQSGASAVSAWNTRSADEELAAAKARIAELEAALTSLAHGDGCFMEAAYKEGWSDAGSPYDFDHAESSWEESHAAGDARRAAALLKEDNQ